MTTETCSFTLDQHRIMSTSEPNYDETNLASDSRLWGRHSMSPNRTSKLLSIVSNLHRRRNHLDRQWSLIDMIGQILRAPSPPITAASRRPPWLS